jgi:hypothetical protein
MQMVQLELKGTVPELEGTVPELEGTVPELEETVPELEGTVPIVLNDLIQFSSIYFPAV